MTKKQRKQYRLNGFNHLNGEGGEGILSIISGMFSSFSKRIIREIVGMFFIVIAIISFLSILGLTLGTWLDFWVSFLQRWFGAGSFLFAIGIAYLGYRIIVPLEEKQDVNVWRKLISFEIAIFSGLGLLDLIGRHAINQASSFGGLIGWGVGMIFQAPIGPISPLLADILQGLILSLVFIYGILTGVRKIGKFFLNVEKKLSGQYEVYSTQSIQKSTFGLEDFGEEQKPSTLKRKKRKEASTFKQLPRESYLPGLDLLINDQSIKPDERHINQNAGLIEKTLMDFGIPAKVVGFQIGPTVTQFAVEPGYLEKTVGYEGESRQKVKVSQIARLKKDIALALSADRVRIEAPVPGRTYVGIEVPNKLRLHFQRIE
jgi:S-DNA-T family DNA segregation ATPase FtsK/SpoIIIE